MQLYLLGRTELFDDCGNRVSLPTKRVLLLLAILAMNPGKSIARHLLCEAIWPDSNPEASRTSLRNALASMRKALGASAVLATEDQISLQEDIVVCDAFELPSVDGYVGDFMPGFSDDWVLDERLRLRLLVIEKALEEAIQLPADEALALLEKSALIDPMNQDIAERRIELLESLGKATEAAQTATSYQVLVLRELGLVTSIEPKVKPETAPNPLVTTAEWLLERNPEEAIAFLAATRSSWLAMDGTFSLNLHERVLQASPSRSSSRGIVDAQRLYLMWIVGRFEETFSSTKTAFEEALQDREFETAWILGNALSYGSLSLGQFDFALRNARRLHAYVVERNNPVELLRSARNLAIIEMHAGKDLPWQNRLLDGDLESGLDSAEEMAQHSLMMTTVNLRLGKLDAAAVSQAHAQRFFEANGWNRMVGYSIFGKAEILSAAGDYSEAIDVLSEIRNLGIDTIGHTLASSVDDVSGQLYAKLSELDQAAESLARSILLRRRLGSKASILESQALKPTRRLLKEQLNERDIRAAFGRARLSSASPTR